MNRTSSQTIAITLDPSDHRHAARFAASLRCHPRFDGRIYALEPDGGPEGKAVLSIPGPSQGVQALLDRVFDIHAVIGIDAILPTREEELLALAANADALTRLGIGTFLPTAAQLELTRRSRLDGLARDLGIRGPGGAVPNWSQVFLATVLGDGEGGLHGAVVRAVDDGYPRRATGSLLRTLGRFSAATWWRGPCELQLVRDLDGVFRLLGVSPGMPAWACRGDGRGYLWAWSTLARGGRFETQCEHPSPEVEVRRSASPRPRTLPLAAAKRRSARSASA